MRVGTFFFVCLFLFVFFFPWNYELWRESPASAVASRIPSLVRTTFEQPSDIIQRPGN